MTCRDCSPNAYLGCSSYTAFSRDSPPSAPSHTALSCSSPHSAVSAAPNSSPGAAADDVSRNVHGEAGESFGVSRKLVSVASVKSLFQNTPRSIFRNRPCSGTRHLLADQTPRNGMHRSCSWQVLAQAALITLLIPHRSTPNKSSLSLSASFGS